MPIILRPEAEEDFAFFAHSKPKLAQKIGALLTEIEKTPFTGTGKPEPLKHQLSGCWSRRIDREHRLVYRVEGKTIIVLTCRHHYE